MSRFAKIALLIAMIACAVGIVFYLGGFILLYVSPDSAYNNTDNRKYVFTEEINSIDADISCGSLVIRHGGSSMEVNCEDVYIPGLTVQCSDGRLVIIIESEKDFTVGGWRLGHNFGMLWSPKPVITITVPDDIQLGQFRAEIGVGDLVADTICADRVVIQVATGDVTVDDLVVDDIAGVQLGAGSFSCTSCDIHGLELSLGCGGAQITTVDGYQNYSIEATCSAGGIYVGEHTTEGVDCEFIHGSSSGRFIIVRDEAGNIHID